MTPLRRLLPAVTLLSVAFFLAAAPVAQPAFERQIDPFPVLNADGEPYAHPFFGGLNSPRPQLVDVTGNGRLDLVVQEVRDRLILFENIGDGEGGYRFAWRSDDWQGLEVGTWFRFGDLTGNGVLDVIAQEPSGQVRFFRNTGTVEAPAFELAAAPLLDTAGDPLRAEDPNVPALADIDGDGRLDLFMGQADRGHIRYYRHTGVVDGVPQFEHVTERFQGIEIYEPNPSCDPAFMPEVPPTPDAEVPAGTPAPSLGGRPGGGPTLHGENALAFADVTGDGTLDLFWGDFFTPSLYYFRNEGTPTEPELSFVSPRFPLDNPLTTAGYNAPAFGDLTGDGALDLIIGIVGGFCSSTANLVDNLYLLQNRGTPAEPDFTEATGRLIEGVDVGRVSFPAFSDLTGNGRLDLLVGSAYNPRTDGPRRGSLYLYENVGEEGAPAFRLADDDFLALDLDFANHYAPAFADLSGDGRPDLVVGTFGGRIFWLRQGEGTGAFGEPETLMDTEGRRLDVGQTAAPAFADLTGNGLPDLVAGSFRGTLHFYRNVGAPGEPVFELETRTFLDHQAGRFSAPHFTDLTGNGLPDLLVGSEHEGVHVYLNVGTVEAPAFEPAEPLAVGRAQLAPTAVDLFGRGRSDLVLGTRAGGLVFLSNQE